MRSFWLVMLAILTVSMLAGCANVGQQLKTEREAFNGVLLAIHSGHIVGALPAATEAKMLPDLKVAQAALDAGDKAYLAGDHNTASVYLKAATAAVQKVQQLYGPATPASATQPATRTSMRSMPRHVVLRAGWFRILREPQHVDATPIDDIPNALMFAPHRVTI